MKVHTYSEWEKYGVVAGYSTDLEGLYRYNEPEDRTHFEELGKVCDIPASRMIRLHQEHTDKILFVDETNGGEGTIREGTPEGYDGLITREKDFMLLVVTADCTPVFLYDPVCGVVGILHSGRAGTMKDIAGKAVDRMESECGSLPQNIQCILGPYLCAKHHEVERKDIEGFYETFTEAECKRILTQKGIKYYVDMGEAIRISLEKKGVLDTNIKDYHVCTYEDKSLYSWRRDHLPHKRIISYVCMKGL